MLEDNQFDAELNQRALYATGKELDIRVVNSGKEFEKALSDFCPDLVLSDFSLPGYNGFSALKAVKEHDADMPLILVTGAIGEVDAVEMLKQGASDYILKDRLARLPEAVNQSLKNAERKRQLKQSEDRYRLIMESSHYGLWDWDLDSNELYLSPQWKQMLGYADNELANSFETFQSLLHEDDRSMVKQTIERFLEHPDKWDVEFRMNHKNGNPCWINARASFETDESNRVTRMLGVHIDVTQRHKADERLRQAAQVFSSTVEGVTITDPRGFILDVNPAFTEITGFDRQEVIGKNQSILKSGRHPGDFYQAMWQSLHSEGFWKGEIWNRRKDGQIYPALLTISAVKDEQQETSGYVGVFSDITQSKQTEARLEFLAHHDPLTRLPNRLLFGARLTQALRHARRRKNKLAVLFIDLDRFKHINDSLGHAVGDQLLKLVAERLKGSIRSDDTLARISGDEFVLMLEHIESVESVSNVIRTVIRSFRNPFTVDQRELNVTCSIGVSIYPDNGSDSDELVKNADAAMYRAKEEGRNTYQFYSPEMTASAFEHVFIENALRNALAHGELFQVYQPQYWLKNGSLAGCETLIRWNNPQQGLISPQRFIPLAEKSGLIREIDTWMLMRACEQAKIWSDQGLPLQTISVNMTGSQVQRDDFAESILLILKNSSLPFDRLEIEVTESFVMQRPESGVSQLQKLYDLGVRIAVDDFGTGYSSLSYLKNLPITKIKLDQSFTRDITQDRDTAAIVKAIIEMGRALNKTITAEGVETNEQAQMLRELGCDQVQGFLFSKPVDVESMTELLEKPGQSWASLQLRSG